MNNCTNYGPVQVKVGNKVFSSSRILDKQELACFESLQRKSGFSMLPVIGELAKERVTILRREEKGKKLSNKTRGFFEKEAVTRAIKSQQDDTLLTTRNVFKLLQFPVCIASFLAVRDVVPQVVVPLAMAYIGLITLQEHLIRKQLSKLVNEIISSIAPLEGLVERIAQDILRQLKPGKAQNYANN